MLRTAQTEQDKQRFLQNQDKARYLAGLPNLRNKIEEFYRIQADFHTSMAKLVTALSEAGKDEQDGDQYSVEELLKPYRALASKNPFQTKPTGNLEHDIDHIINVISAQHAEFKLALTAMQECTARKTQMNKLFTHFRENSKVADKIKSQLGVASWMLVEGQADKPFQLLMRYELFLKSIHQGLIDTGAENSDAIMRGLMSSIEILVPDIKVINDNLDTIILLNNIEHTLTAILKLDKIKQAPVVEVKKYDVPLDKKMEFVIDCAMTGKQNILSQTQDVQLLFQNLHDLLVEVDQQLEPFAARNARNYLSPTAVYNGYHTLYTALFGNGDNDGSKLVDPFTELKTIIREMHTTLERIESLKAIAEMNQSKAGLKK